MELIMRLSGKEVCYLLNEMAKESQEFMAVIRSRVSVSEEFSNESSVLCSAIDGGLFDTSPLGFIGAMTDEPICLIQDKGESKIFCTIAEADKQVSDNWDKYESDVAEFNLKNGTDHKPDPRPENVKATDVTDCGAEL